jgi:CxxC motif-containing protein
MRKEITCIICPIGCRLMVEYEDNTILKIEGFECKKGKKYASEELLNPVRTLTTTIVVKDGEIPLVSVKTDKPIPKDKLFEVMDVISEIEVFSPVSIGDVLVKNVLDFNADIVATKNVERLEK